MSNEGSQKTTLEQVNGLAEIAEYMNDEELFTGENICDISVNKL